MNKWAFQWKMSFNPDPNKQAQEVIFSRKRNKPNHPSLNFNNTVVIQSTNHTLRYDFGYSAYKAYNNDKAYNSLFHRNLEKIQCNSALAIARAMSRTSKEKLYIELGLESLGRKR